MRFVLIGAGALAAVLMLDARPTYAQSAYDYPWCAYYTGKAGGSSCYFSSYGQCRATVSGIGGFCSPNPVYRGGAGVYRQHHGRRWRDPY